MITAPALSALTFPPETETTFPSELLHVISPLSLPPSFLERSSELFMLSEYSSPSNLNSLSAETPVTAMLFELLLIFAVIVAVPTPLIVTLPFSTEAILSSLLVHSICSFEYCG